MRAALIPYCTCCEVSGHLTSQHDYPPRTDGQIRQVASDIKEGWATARQWLARDISDGVGGPLNVSPVPEHTPYAALRDALDALDALLDYTDDRMQASRVALEMTTDCRGLDWRWI